MENGGEAAKHLSAFYSALRSKIFEAHLKASPEILKKQIEFVVDVRQAWQQVDKPNLGPGYSAVEAAPPSRVAEFSMAGAGNGLSANTWTA